MIAILIVQVTLAMKAAEPIIAYTSSCMIKFGANPLRIIAYNHPRAAPKTQ